MIIYFLLFSLGIFIYFLVRLNIKKDNLNYFNETISFLLYISILIIMFLTILPTFMMTGIENNHVNLVLFKTIKHYIYLIKNKIYLKYAYSNLIGNIILFYPFGLLISFKIKRYKFIKIIVISLLFSSFIELFQFFLKRISDIDDIVLNVMGSILGYLTYLLFKLFKKKH